MRRLGLVLPFALAAAAAACGDNSKECGEGTTDKDGVCTPDGTAICGDGTTLDTSSGACVPDPSLCGGGTVLINGICQDPTAGLTIDLEEGPEPNGFDPGSTPAGVISLKPIGDPNGFVVHGCVKPTEDFADLDDYRLTVQGPTLIDITADGVHGLAAGFVSLTNDAALPSWQRFGINLANDMSHREIYLPKAGTYDLALSDTRSLLGLVDGATDYLEPAGNPDGTSCYYVTLKQEAIPAPTPMPVPAGVSGTFDNKIHFYTPQMPTGYIDMVETTTSLHAGTALVLNVSDNLYAIDTAGEIFTAGIKATDVSVVVADYVYDYGITAADYTIAFNSASTALPLPTDGTSVATTVNGHSFTFPDFSTTNQFYFDATAANQIFGMRITSTKPLSGVVADAAGVFVDSSLAWGGLGGAATWTAYNGLWRAPAPGRYYFIVFDPNVADTNTALSITSTLTALTPAAVTVGTPLTAQPNNTFNSNPYTVNVTGNTWDSVNATGTNTGNLNVVFVDPATAKGRLNTLTLTTPQTNANALPIASYNFPAAGATKGLITKAIPQTALLATVSPVTPTAGATFGVDIGTRVFTNMMAITAPHTTQMNAETVASGDAHRYYFTTAPGNLVTITVHTTGGDPILDTLLATEATAVETDDNGNNVDETFTYVQDASGFTAFHVKNFAAAAMTYDLTVDVQAPYYTKHAGTTTYADACAGGTTVPLIATGTFPASDEGLSAVITAPAGFTFFGAATTQFKLGSNGFLSFNTALTSALTGSAPMPDGVGNANIAAYWDDLENVVICTKVVGGKTVIQWTGDEYNSLEAVQFQAILDPADDSIEFVYGPGQVADGTADAVTAGAQNAGGTEGTSAGNGAVAAFAAPNTAVKLTHP